MLCLVIDGAGSSEGGHRAEEHQPRSQSAQQRERHSDGSKPAAGRGRTMAMQPQGPPPPQDYNMHGSRGGMRTAIALVASLDVCCQSQYWTYLF